MSAVEIRNVTKTFSTVTAVDQLSLSIPEGSVYGFIGPNGSGKSTTMRMIARIIYPDSGSIQVFGRNSNGERSSNIGYLPEERGLYRNARARAIGISRRAARRAQRHRRGRHLARTPGPDTLRRSQSRDSQQRHESEDPVHRHGHPAAAHIDPREPFTGLDPVSADAIRRAILEMRSRGCTVILSTHDMAVAESLCDTIFMIFRGRKVLDGTVASIQSNYSSDTIRVEVEGGASALSNLPGVERIKDHGQIQELRMAESCDPQEVLQALAARTKVFSFSVIKPTLHDIFVRIAGPQPEVSLRD